QDKERFFELISLVTDGDLLFLHGFEQRALYFGRGAVDFVGQNQVRKNRASACSETTGLRVVNLCADNVVRQHVGRELQRRKFDGDTCRERFDGERFGQAGHAFEQYVTVGEQADDQPLR